MPQIDHYSNLTQQTDLGCACSMLGKSNTYYPQMMVWFYGALTMVESKKSP